MIASPAAFVSPSDFPSFCNKDLGISESEAFQFSSASAENDLYKCHTGDGVPVLRLSDFLGEGWRSKKNSYGEPAMVDFAMSAPFQLYSEDTAKMLRKTGERYFNSEHEYSTKRTSGCIRGAPDLVSYVDHMTDQLEAMASRIVGGGLRLRVLKAATDMAHLNIQRTVQQRPVDNWHQDSAPFVVVTVLTNHTEDPGGELLVRKKDENDSVHRCKLSIPGQAIFMQGSQIWHMAQQSELGKRMTLVTCFYVEDAMVYDSSSLRAPLGYSPPAEVAMEYLVHALRRFMKNAEISKRISGLSRASALEVNRVMTLEIGKLANDYKMFHLIPERSQNDLGLRAIWDLFGDTVRELEATLHASQCEMESIHLEIASVASKRYQITTENEFNDC